MSAKRPSFAAIGHLTNDVLISGSAPGGSALYASYAAAQLGAQASVVTSVGPDFVGFPKLHAAEVREHNLLAEHTTTFENSYRQGKRSQRVLQVAHPLRESVVDADVVFACPVIGEVEPSALRKRAGSLLGIGLQGWLRSLSPDGTVVRRVPENLDFLSAADITFVSDEDLGEDEDWLLPKLCEISSIVVLTEGSRGARIFVGSRCLRVLAHPVNEVDPTGAGDVFAAAFLVATARGESIEEAAIISACAAAMVVEDNGPKGLDRLSEALPERVAWYKKHIRAPHFTNDLEQNVALTSPHTSE